MRAYSPDLRAKILAAVDAGMTKTEAARTFGVGLATVKRYAVLRRERGTLDPQPRPGRPPIIRPDQLELLRTQLTAHPAAFLDEHCVLFAQQTGTQVSLSTMSRAIRKVGWTRKKGHWVPTNETMRHGNAGKSASRVSR